MFATVLSRLDHQDGMLEKLIEAIQTDRKKTEEYGNRISNLESWRSWALGAGGFVIFFIGAYLQWRLK
jgi:hypothetical protein